MAQLAATVKTPTFTISPEHLQRCSLGPDKPLQRGFTLIELLVVLAIGALIMSLAPTAYNKYRESAQYGTTLRTISAELRQARQNSMTHGVQVVFFVDLARRKYGITDFTSHDLPESLQIKATVGSKTTEELRIASIEFLPDGGSTGGSIDVLRSSGVGTRLRVDWLSGLVTLERLN